MDLFKKNFLFSGTTGIIGLQKLKTKWEPLARTVLSWGLSLFSGTSSNSSKSTFFFFWWPSCDIFAQACCFFSFKISHSYSIAITNRSQQTEKSTSIFKQTGKAGTPPRAMNEENLEGKLGKFSIKLNGRESVHHRKRIHRPDTWDPYSFCWRFRCS